MTTTNNSYEVIEDYPHRSSSPSELSSHETYSGSTSNTPTTVCSICCEILQTSLAASQCGHIYHYECILTWITTSNTCPLCKAVAKPILQLKYDPLQRIKQYIQTVTESTKYGNSSTSTTTLPPTLLYLKKTLDDNELQTKILDLQLQVQQQSSSNLKLQSRYSSLNKQKMKLEEQLNVVQVKYMEGRSVNEPQVRELKALQRDIKKMESELAGRERERYAQEALETTNKILQIQLATNSSASPSPLQLRDQQAALSNVEHQYSGANQHFVVNVLHHYMTLQINNLKSHSTTQQTLADKISLQERQNVGLKYDINERRKQVTAVNEKIQVQISETMKLKKANESQIASIQRRIDRLCDPTEREQLLSKLQEIKTKVLPPTPTQPPLRERSVQAASSSLQRAGSSGIIRTLSRTGTTASSASDAANTSTLNNTSASTVPTPMHRLSKASRSRKRREKAVDDIVDEILSSKPTLPRHPSSTVNLNKIAGHPINLTSSVLRTRTHSNPFQVTSTKRANSNELENYRQSSETDDATQYAEVEVENSAPSRTNSHSNNSLPDPVEMTYNSSIAFMGVPLEPKTNQAPSTVRSMPVAQSSHNNKKKLKRSTSSTSAKQSTIARGQSSLLSFTVPSTGQRASSSDVIVIDEDEPSTAIPIRQQSLTSTPTTNTQLSELIQMLDGG